MSHEQVKRYDPVYTSPSGEKFYHTTAMKTCDDGDYVKYEDYRELKEDLMFSFNHDKLKTALDDLNIEANETFVIARGAQQQWYLIVGTTAHEVELS